MKILITGFDPFGGSTINPAFEAVKIMPDIIKGAEIIKMEIPTVFKKNGLILEAAIKKHNPQVVLCIGQAGGRCGIQVEKVAINLMEARIPDNEKNQPLDEQIEENGENAYFATVPVKSMVINIRKHGIPANISYSAGTFVCNDIMYRLLYMLEEQYQGIIGGFIHVPYLHEQTVELVGIVPSMSATDIAKALEYAVEAIIDNDSDKNNEIHMGTIM